jgi:predicted ATPase
MTTPLIRRLTLQNFLSFGSQGVAVDLLPLNVLIGPNASGKSNLLEALAILRGAARDLQAVVREGGGSAEYIWKGGKGDVHALIETLVDDSSSSQGLISHRIKLGQVAAFLAVAEEQIRKESQSVGVGGRDVLYSFTNAQAVLFASRENGDRTAVPVEGLKVVQSVLSQRRDPDRYPELTALANNYENIALFSEWYFGRQTHMRRPQGTDLPSDFLLSDRSNLALVLHELGQTSGRREELLGYLRRFYENARFISTRIQGGTIQLYIEEEGGRLIPSSRLSDGTLRFLCLLAILCHPTPPPVIGIEEPELGLHPDILPTVAELLRKASERTQLFVTTHSDALVSALSDTPENIIVCESTPDGTTMKRLDAEQLQTWLADYSLGELWRMGEIGGNRW